MELIYYKNNSVKKKIVSYYYDYRLDYTFYKFVYINNNLNCHLY